MAAANLTNHTPLSAVRTISGNTPLTSAVPEVAGQTFPIGAVVEIFTGGFTKVWDGTTYTAGIYGIAESFGQNLGTDGVGAPVPPFGGITGNIAIATYGSVPNQPNAVNIAVGTPVADGRTLYMEPNSDNIFQALFDNSAGTVAANWTPTNADIGVSYGLTKDANGYWYVDKNKTGGSAVLQVVGLPLGSYLNAPVTFIFLAAAVQVL